MARRAFQLVGRSHARQAQQRQSGLRGVDRSGERPKAVGLRECCTRLGISVRTGERLLAVGRFPIPELPREGRARHRFSEVLIDRHLEEASFADVR